MMSDKSVEISIEAFPQYFTISKPTPAQEGGYRKIEVSFEESEDAKKALQQVIDSKLLGMLKMNNVVEDFRRQIKKEAEMYIDYLNNNFENWKIEINKGCKSCEFMVADGVEQNGFKECWGALADVTPHIFDLYYGGTLGRNYLLDEKIKKGRVSLWDIEMNDLVKSDGDVGPRNERQRLQYKHTKSNTEYPETDEDRLKFKESFQKAFIYPLFFIDFETMSSAIPFHRGLASYQMFPFQFSVHKLEANGTLTHYEHLNEEEGYPGFRFAEKLMEIVGYEGTPLMWSHHENTTLKGVLEQLEIRNYDNEKLKTWLEGLVKQKGITEGRFVDMNDFTLKNYFHPSMLGKTSIKKVLPAIWINNGYLHKMECFKDWVVKDEWGNILDPYEKLEILTLFFRIYWYFAVVVKQVGSLWHNLSLSCRHQPISDSNK